ncbi:MAG: glycosyltransferase [bacterium]|nr:glycosyltransferase [bacterium]
MLAREAYKNSYQDYIWKKALKECDTFMLLRFGFEEDYSDYRELKKRGKKIITNFVGDDIRWKPAMEQEFARYSLQPIEYRDYTPRVKLARQIHYLRTAEKHADMIISLPNQSQLALRPYYNFYYPIDLNRIDENTRQRKEIPIVVHAPTSREFKGTRYILDVFKQLAQDGVKFQPEFIENMDRYKALERYRNADILVGQVLCPGGGTQAYELLAGGKVVLTRMGFDSYPQIVGKNCPIVDVGSENLYEKLKAIILDYPRRQELAALGRAYVKQNHDVKKLCKNIVECLENKSEKEDFFPDFFRETFIPESPGLTWLYNKYTGYVKHCDWYREMIPPGRRDGLTF